MRIDSGIWSLSSAGQRTEQGKDAEEAKSAPNSEKAPQTETTPQKEISATELPEKKITPQCASFTPKRRLSLQEEMEQQVQLRNRALEQMRQQMADMAENAEEERERERIEKLCFEISERVFAGDKVPASDLSFLRKHDSGLYARAILLRVKKRKPYGHRRLTRGSDLYDKPGTLVIKGGRNDKYLISGLAWKELSSHPFGPAFDETSSAIAYGGSSSETASGSSPDTAPGTLLDTKG